MRRVLLALVLAVSFVGFARAQQGEMTGEEAEKIKVEIVTLELQKLTYLVQNGAVAANWRDTHDSEVIVGVSEKGINRHSREETTAKMLSGELFMISQTHFGHRVHVYANGTVAVCTCYCDALFRRDGKAVPHKTLDVDVWTKFPDGQWHRIVHNAHQADPGAIPTKMMLPIIGVENHPS